MRVLVRPEGGTPRHGYLVGRPLLSQDDAVHEYSPLQRLVEQAGPLCPGYFVNLERKTTGVLTAKRIRFLRLAMTKDARSTVITALADPNCTINSLNVAAEGANFDMWVDFHWVADNPHLHRELCMSWQPQF